MVYLQKQQVIWHRKIASIIMLLEIYQTIIRLIAKICFYNGCDTNYNLHNIL